MTVRMAGGVLLAALSMANVAMAQSTPATLIDSANQDPVSAAAPDASTKTDQPVEAPPPGGELRGSFFKRLARAYAHDWRATESTSPEPPFRLNPAPESDPPYPFSVWPYGGAPTIGQPDPSPSPLTQAIWQGSKRWEQSRVKIYGWLNYGGNLSTSSQKNGLYANLPAAYPEIPNTIQLDQFTLYVERTPDTVQTDHFDWGFRLTNLYGLDYRFTTAKGYFSSQLLERNPPLGNKYGYDPVMFYVDLYWPKVAEGMNIRIGRYISLPDIEAQLAPNNYMYSHSLTYTYDCYTQTGINATITLTKHWMVQGSVSPGCEAAPWIDDAKLTGTACVGYTWNNGGDNLYTCANAINTGKYAYNNLNAYYTTWYHKINSEWHMAWESWYQFERDVPNVNPAAPSSVLAAAAPLLETNANGAWCSRAAVTCYAPDWATVYYLNRQLSTKRYVSLRNEYFNDMAGQRTGYKTRYTEHALSYNWWLGSTVLIRPELRYEHAYDQPAYDGGTRKTQFSAAADLLFFY
jgi:hypothetical protein